MKTVMEFTYLGDRVSAGGGCEAAVTARTRCELVNFKECCDLLCRKRLLLLARLINLQLWVFRGLGRHSS